MRYDKEHKRETRVRVLDAAARAIRKAGPDRVAVAGVMADAGLTHGGFYAHFNSKEELVTAAIKHMFDQTAERRLDEIRDLDPARGLSAYVNFYLSPKHRDARSSGCPVAALSSDLPRLGDASRLEFSRGVQHLVSVIAGMLASLGHAEAEALARSIIAEMVGALALARIEPQARKSTAILESSRKEITNRLGLEELT